MSGPKGQEFNPVSRCRYSIFRKIPISRFRSAGPQRKEFSTEEIPDENNEWAEVVGLAENSQTSFISTLLMEILTTEIFVKRKLAFYMCQPYVVELAYEYGE